MSAGTLPPTAQRRNYSAPFNFATALRPPDTNLALLPVVDLCVLALLFSLLFTRFVALPGIAVSMPETTLRLSPGSERVAVLTISAGERFYFDGNVFELNSLAGGLERFMQRFPDENSVLMLRIESSFGMNDFMRISELAQASGFREIQILAEATPPANTLFAPPETLPGAIR